MIEVLIFVRFREAKTFLPPRFEFMLFPPATLDASDASKVPNFSQGKLLTSNSLRIFLPVGHEIGLPSPT
jgi:hypothetical protein